MDRWRKIFCPLIQLLLFSVSLTCPPSREATFPNFLNLQGHCYIVEEIIKTFLLARVVPYFITYFYIYVPLLELSVDLV